MSIQTAYTEKPRGPGRLQSLIAEDGELQITVEGGELPAFLLEANQAVITGRIDQARQCLCPENIAQIAQSLEQDSTRTDLMFILAKLFLDTHQRASAEDWLRKILEIEAHPRVLKELADLCFSGTGRRSEALEYSVHAYQLAPDDASICSNYGRDLIYAGRVAEGIRYLHKAAEKAPDNAGYQVSPLWYHHYLPEEDRPSFLQAYRAWARRFAPLHLCCRDHLNQPEPQRRLRVGYISPNFCRNAVAYTFEPVLDGHNRKRVELFGYGNVSYPDEITARLQGKFDQYRDIRGVEADAIAEQIRLDRVDILVTLGGHCTGNCLPVLAYKPAPIQADFGGISTTGMAQMDYFITDEILDPSETQAFYTEQLAYVPGGSLAYRPPSESPLVGPLPAQSKKFVTFGSFNNHIKINDLTIRLWCQVLGAVPNSRMILKFLDGHDPGLQTHYQEWFAQYGISPDRILVKGAASYIEHLRDLGQVDMALDAYPFNGCITTLEALWMGVPIVSLSGPTCVSCIGRDIMTQLGLEIFVATNADEFVARARSFAAQSDSLASIRRSLRSLMLNSALCQPERIARELEVVYQQMWRHW